MAISFDVSRADHDTIMEIVKRGEGLDAKFDSKQSRLSSVMDLTACHANGNPLRLADLLVADDTNFVHDWYGIRRYIDRETGQMTDCFSPRFTAHGANCDA